MPRPHGRLRRRGGIGQALGLRNAKLGMKVEGVPGDEGPAPGTPEFGYRAWTRMKSLKGKRGRPPIQLERTDPAKNKDLKA